MCEVDFKKETEKIKKYIKWMFGITNIKIRVVQTLDGYAGDSDRDIRKIRLTMAGVKDKNIIWHEVGHIMAKKHEEYSCSYNEVEAEIWSINQMIKKGYNRMYAREIREMIAWSKEPAKNERNDMYIEAGEEVLRRLRKYKKYWRENVGL